MSDHVDCAVVGAGVISLAVAGVMALQGLDVLVPEAPLLQAPTLAWVAKARLYGYYEQRGIHR